MISKDLILKFENVTVDPLFIVIDPPCAEFRLETGESLKLKIIDYKGYSGDVSEVVNVRYCGQNSINIDINFSFKLIVAVNNEEMIIWS